LNALGTCGILFRTKNSLKKAIMAKNAHYRPFWSPWNPHRDLTGVKNSCNTYQHLVGTSDKHLNALSTCGTLLRTKNSVKKGENSKNAHSGPIWATIPNFLDIFDLIIRFLGLKYI